MELPNPGRLPPRARVALALLFGAITFLPFILQLAVPPGADDWDQHFTWYFAAWRSFAVHGQLPLWNPWMCGGMADLGNPQSRWLTPLWLLQLLMGPWPGLVLDLVLHTAFGVLGIGLLARRLGCTRDATALLAGAFFLWSSWLGLHIGVGHVWSMTYGWMGWVFWAALEAEAEWAAPRGPVRFIAVAGGLLALMVFEAGIYPVPQTALLLVFGALVRGIQQRSLVPLRAVAAIGVAALLLSAPKLLPMAELMSRSPRHVDSPEAVGPELLLQLALDFDQDRYRATENGTRITWGFHENGTFIGALVLCFALWGVQRLWKRERWLVLSAVVALLFGLGDFNRKTGRGWAPWPALHRLPLFASQHVPTRWLIPAALFICLLAAVAIDASWSAWGRRGRALLVTAIALWLGLEWLVSTPNLAHAFDARLPEAEPPGQFEQRTAKTSRRMSAAVLGNWGALDCYEEARPPRAALGVESAEYRGEVHTREGRPVETVEWSPHRLTFRVAEGEEALLLVNQNFHRSWRSATPGLRLREEKGLLAVQVPAGGAQEVVLEFVSLPFRIGLAVALATTTGLVLLDRRRRGRLAV